MLVWLVLGWAKEPFRYVLISSPSTSQVQYLRIPGPSDPQPLLDSGDGLMTPSGIAAIDDHRKGGCKCVWLYVADPGHRKILQYRIQFTNGELQYSGSFETIVSNVEAKWIAVDHVGALFYTDGVSVHTVGRNGPLLQGSSPSFKPASLIYNGESTTEVNKPAGLTTDNFNVFWVNSAEGLRYGSVIKAPEDPDPDEGPVPIYEVAKNADAVVAPCLTQNNVFFTSTDRAIFGVKKTGGAVATIVEAGVLQAPKGCAWDGDGTVYVADEGGNALYSFPGNMRSLAPTKLDKHRVPVAGPVGLAVVQAPSCAFLFALVHLLV